MRSMLIGAICGLAWAAGFRGFMAEVAGPGSAVDWAGTFGGILVPGMVAGALLGWAEHCRRTGGRRAWRWLASAPLVFVAATPGAVVSVFIDGIGGGALAIPVFGMAGGYALSGRGPAWSRACCAVVALIPIPAWAVSASLVGGSALALDTPRGAWVAVLFYSFLAVSALACSIPHRRIAGPGEQAVADRAVPAGVPEGLRR